MIDRALIKVHQGANRAYGARKTSEKQSIGHTEGSINTKIHAVIDALEKPIKFILSKKQRHDSGIFNSFIKAAKDT